MTDKIVMDLDGTIARLEQHKNYEEREPDKLVVEQIRTLHANGFEIVIYTSRNMHTYENNIGQITAFTVPKIISWLNKHDIPYNEIHIGKPWCGHNGFYVDDRAIRPSEFKSLNQEQILKLLETELQK